MLSLRCYQLLCCRIEKSLMHNLSSTEEAITFSLADFSIGTNIKDLVFEELNGFESNLFIFLFPCHCAMWLSTWHCKLQLFGYTQISCMYWSHDHSSITVGWCEVTSKGIFITMSVNNGYIFMYGSRLELLCLLPRQGRDFHFLQGGLLSIQADDILTKNRNLSIIACNNYGHWCWNICDVSNSQ